MQMSLTNHSPFLTINMLPSLSRQIQWMSQEHMLVEDLLIMDSFKRKFVHYASAPLFSSKSSFLLTCAFHGIVRFVLSQVLAGGVHAVYFIRDSVTSELVVSQKISPKFD